MDDGVVEGDPAPGLDAVDDESVLDAPDDVCGLTIEEEGLISEVPEFV
jgi:hypothetical protein